VINDSRNHVPTAECGVFILDTNPQTTSRTQYVVDKSKGLGILFNVYTFCDLYIGPGPIMTAGLLLNKVTQKLHR
jgi:hypothetical protein